jgi:hypothetical protein
MSITTKLAITLFFAIVASRGADFPRHVSAIWESPDLRLVPRRALMLSVMSMTCRLGRPIMFFSNTIPLNFFAGIRGNITVMRYDVGSLLDDAVDGGVSETSADWIRSRYERLSLLARSDVLRLLLLYRLGGTYLDPDLVVISAPPDISGILPRSDGPSSAQDCIPSEFADDMPPRLGAGTVFDIRANGAQFNHVARSPLLRTVLDRIPRWYVARDGLSIGPKGLGRGIGAWVREQGHMPPNIHTIPESTLIPSAWWSEKKDFSTVVGSGGIVFHPIHATRGVHGRPPADTVYGQASLRTERECAAFLPDGMTLDRLVATPTKI